MIFRTKHSEEKLLCRGIIFRLLFDVRQELAVQFDDDAILAGNAFHRLNGDVDIDGGPGIIIKEC